jgi:predicted methyltransferase
MKLIERIAGEVEKNTKVTTYPKSVEKVLSAVMATPNFWKIVDLSDEPLPLVAEVLKLLNYHGIVVFEDNRVLLTEAGRRLVREAGITPSVSSHRCPRCGGRGVVIDNFRSAFEMFLRVQKDRPPAVHHYDQGYVTPENTFARIALADERGDVRGKSVVVLGDDDLMSVALAMTGLPSKVTVLEIDERLVNFIDTVSKEYRLNIDVRLHDLRKPLPADVVAGYDTFFTDPPETVEAIKAFVGRGVATLKGERCAGYFGVTRRESSLDKWRKIQQVLLDMGLVVTEIVHNFNEYVNWDYYKDMRGWKLSPVKEPPSDVWYRSTQFRVETVRGFKGFNDYISGDIYTDHESSTT